MIHVLATIEIYPGHRADFLAQFHWLVPHVRAEDGCIEYGAAIDTPTGIAVQIPNRPDVVMVIEKWRDLPALELHLQAPHMQEYRERVKAFVQKVSLQVLAPSEPE